MKTWDAYKDHVKKVDPDAKRDIEEMENIAAIVSRWWKNGMISESRKETLPQCAEFRSPRWRESNRFRQHRIWIPC